MTKREIIYDVIERMKANSDDADLSPEHISFVIDSARSLLIEQKYGKKAWNTITSIQQQLCLGLEVVSAVDGFECFGTILRTEDVIPDGINFTGIDSSLMRVSTYDKRALQVSIVAIERLPYLGHDSFANNILYTAIDPDRKIYFFSNAESHKMLQAVKINGVYNDVDAASLLGCQDFKSSMLTTKSLTPRTLPNNVSSVIEPWDTEYPFEQSMMERLMDVVIKKLTRREALPEDNMNDAEDNKA